MTDTPDFSFSPEAIAEGGEAAQILWLGMAMLTGVGCLTLFLVGLGTALLLCCQAAGVNVRWGVWWTNWPIWLAGACAVALGLGVCTVIERQERHV